METKGIAAVGLIMMAAFSRILDEERAVDAEWGGGVAHSIVSTGLSGAGQLQACGQPG